MTSDYLEYCLTLVGWIINNGGGARRMAETAALLADEVPPEKPLRQWVLSLPFALRFLLATDSQALTHVLAIVYRTIPARSDWLISQPKNPCLAPPSGGSLLRRAPQFPLASQLRPGPPGSTME